METGHHLPLTSRQDTSPSTKSWSKVDSFVASGHPVPASDQDFLQALPEGMSDIISSVPGWLSLEHKSCLIIRPSDSCGPSGCHAGDTPEAAVPGRPLPMGAREGSQQPSRHPGGPAGQAKGTAELPYGGQLGLQGWD